MMSCKRIADPLQFIQRGFQRPLLDPAFAHDIAQQGDANVTHLRQRVGTRFPLAKLPDHVRAVQQHHAPAQQPAPGERVLAVIELADVMINQRFIFTLTKMRFAAELIDKPPA